MCVDAGLRSWDKNLDIIKGERVPTDDDYQNLMRASMMAGMAIAQDGTALPHGFSYGLTTRKHVPHGKAVGYFTAGYLACADQKDREYLLKTAGFTSLEDFQEVLYKACGPVDVDEDFLMTLVEEMSVNTAKLKAVPYHVGRDELVKIALYTKKSGY
jgi:alcohol dehydrogenase